MTDTKQPPDYYSVGGIEVRRVIEAKAKAASKLLEGDVLYHWLSSIKYLLRAPFKESFKKDMKKCMDHVGWALELHE